MKSQDEFLREVVNELLNIGSYDANGLGRKIEERLSLLKPVAYENRDLSSGLSWDGNVICGDRKSIDAVKNALDDLAYNKARADTLERQFNQLQAIVDRSLALLENSR